MNVLGIDPGPEKSAYVYWVNGRPTGFGFLPNLQVKESLGLVPITQKEIGVIAIEMVACYGMPVGKDVFDTCLWIGRFVERAPIEPRLICRRDIKLHHCGNVRAKDANIRQALIDKYGQPGTKKNKGLLYGIKSHLWAALALATYVAETEHEHTQT